VRRGRAHKDGLSCNRGSTQEITGSRIRHDDSKNGIALLRLTEELHQKLAQWRRLAQMRCLKGRSTAVAVAPDGRSLKARGAPVKRSGLVVDIPQRRRC
jgi:hypothetical protein